MIDQAPIKKPKKARKKPKKARKKFKNVEQEMTLSDAISYAMSDFQTLRDEMRDWASNMEGTGLENTEKYTAVSECADALESFCDDEPEVPTFIEADYQPRIKFNEQTRIGNRGMARWLRASNAESAIEAVKNYAETQADKLKTVNPEASAGWQALYDACDNIANEAQGLDFPGMY